MDEEYKRKVLDEGVEGYFQKLHNAEQLIRAVNKILEDKKRG